MLALGRCHPPHPSLDCTERMGMALGVLRYVPVRGTHTHVHNGTNNIQLHGTRPSYKTQTPIKSIY